MQRVGNVAAFVLVAVAAIDDKKIGDTMGLASSTDEGRHGIG